jgi:hypothetical protein
VDLWIKLEVVHKWTDDGMAGFRGFVVKVIEIGKESVA